MENGYYRPGEIINLASIAERDAKFKQVKPGGFVYVADASADPNVKIGSAFYYWEKRSLSWILHKSFEIDFSEWATVTGYIENDRLVLASEPNPKHLFDYQMFNTQGFRESQPTGYEIVQNADTGAWEVFFHVGANDPYFRNGWTVVYTYIRFNRATYSGEVRIADVQQSVNSVNKDSKYAVSVKGLVEYLDTTERKSIVSVDALTPPTPADEGSFKFDTSSGNLLFCTKLNDSLLWVAVDGQVSASDIVAPVESYLPVNDPRLTEDVASKASVRSLGVGATQASAGNHRHTIGSVGIFDLLRIPDNSLLTIDKTRGKVVGKSLVQTFIHGDGEAEIYSVPVSSNDVVVSVYEVETGDMVYPHVNVLNAVLTLKYSSALLTNQYKAVIVG